MPMIWTALYEQCFVPLLYKFISVYFIYLFIYSLSFKVDKNWIWFILSLIAYMVVK